MNKFFLTGRPTTDPETRYTEKGMAVSQFTLAVDRRSKDQGADFIRIKAFDKRGEFAEKYVRKGARYLVCGHIMTGSYEGKDGKRVYTTDFIADDIEFADGKSDAGAATAKKADETWMSVPESVDEELPFN